MNRSELVTLSSGKQKAAFRTFTPEKRKQLWFAKFNQIKSLNFSKEELNHLKIFEKFLKKYDFSNELTKKQEEFLNSWFEKGKLNFEWTPYFLVSGFAMLNEDAVLSKKEFKKAHPEISLKFDPSPIGPDSGDCDCRWDITCQLAQLGECSDTACEEVPFSCGWLTMQTCTGDCSG